MAAARALAAAAKERTGKPSLPHRPVVKGILWSNRTGAPWRDLPARYGKWETVASRFYRWRKAGVWDEVLQALQKMAEANGEIDWETHHVDSTVVRAHQHAGGQKGGARLGGARSFTGWIQYQTTSAH